MRTASSPRSFVAATVATAPITGPAHGVKISPRLTPSTNPLPTSPGCRRESAWNGRDSSSPSGAQRSESPTTMTTPMARFLRRSSGSPSADRRAVAVSVKTVKLATRPATMA